MVLLEDRLWSGFACGPRMVFMPSAIIAICLAALALGLLKVALDRWVSPGPKFDYPPAWIGSRLAWWSAGSLAAVCALAFLFVVISTPSLTSIATDGRVVVETGCDRSQIYTKRIDIAGADIRYRHPKQARDYSRHFIVFSDGRNDIRISLERERNYPVLIAIAPDAMREFAQWIADKGWRMPPSLAE